MKTLLALFAVALLAPQVASACPGCDKETATTTKASDFHAKPAAKSAQAAAPSARPLAAGESRLTIPVSGMHCDQCVSRVQTALRGVDGVKAVDADVEKGQAVVIADTKKVDPAKLTKTIDALGFKAGAPSQN